MGAVVKQSSNQNILPWQKLQCSVYDLMRTCYWTCHSYHTIILNSTSILCKSRSMPVQRLGSLSAFAVSLSGQARDSCAKLAWECLQRVPAYILQSRRTKRGADVSCRNTGCTLYTLTLSCPLYLRRNRRHVAGLLRGFKAMPPTSYRAFCHSLWFRVLVWGRTNARCAHTLFRWLLANRRHVLPL